jgi:thiol-disulfide isomerase/thioredoxin
VKTSATALRFREYPAYDPIVDGDRTELSLSPPETKESAYEHVVVTKTGGAAPVPKNYHASYYETVDVDGDRMSLLSLLEPKAAPFKPVENTKAAVARPTIQGRVSSRVTSQRQSRNSPVTSLHSIQDYHRHVLDEPSTLCIVRFSAPWCKVCQSTNVSWERMASKIQKLAGGRSRPIKFLAVSIDGKDEEAAALKDMLQISRVPQGIVHHPSEGVYGQKVDLNRKNLSSLRKSLERYLDEDGMDSGTMLEGLIA